MLKVRGEMEYYEELAQLEFTPARRRMTAAVRRITKERYERLVAQAEGPSEEGEEKEEEEEGGGGGSGNTDASSSSSSSSSPSSSSTTSSETKQGETEDDMEGVLDDGRVYLYTKGGDDAILSRCQETSFLSFFLFFILIIFSYFSLSSLPMSICLSI